MLFNKCKTASKALKAHRIDTIPTLLEVKSSLPYRGVTDRLVQFYLQTFEPLYRILHVPSFQAQYEQFWDRPNDVADEFLVILVLVMAVGLCFEEESSVGLDVRSQIRLWTNAARSYVSRPLEKRRLDLDMIRIHCLLLLAREASSAEGDLVDISGGTLLRLAIQMGLHRDPENLPGPFALHAESRRRLWTTILELVIHSSTELGLPAMISFDDFDTEAPSNLDDKDFDEPSKITSDPKPLETYTETSLQLLLRRTLHARFEVVKIINGCGPQPSYDRILQLGTKILEECHVAKNLLQKFDNTQDSNIAPPSSFHRSFIDYILRRSLIALHWPFAAASYQNPRYYYSRKICLDSALVFSSYQDTDQFSRLIIRGGGFSGGLLVHGGSILLSEIRKQLDEDNNDLLSLSKNLLREPLRAAVQRIIDTILERMKWEENNVKAYLFFSMVLGQIDALESGIPSEIGICEAAKQAGQICLDTLSARAVKSQGTQFSVGSHEDDIKINRFDQPEPDGATEGATVYSDADADFGFAAIQDSLLDFDVPQSWLFNTWGDF